MKNLTIAAVIALGVATTAAPAHAGIFSTIGGWLGIGGGSHSTMPPQNSFGSIRCSGSRCSQVAYTYVNAGTKRNPTWVMTDHVATWSRAAPTNQNGAAVRGGDGAQYQSCPC